MKQSKKIEILKEYLNSQDLEYKDGDLENYEVFSETEAEEVFKERLEEIIWECYLGSRLKDGFLQTIADFIDFDGLADYVERWDGRGPTLASYDGEEREFKFNDEYFFIYRQY